MRLTATVAMASVLVALTGCSSDWGSATGTASLDGNRLKGGLVTFHPAQPGPIGYANITADGTFKVMTGDQPGLKTGDYVVTVIEQTIPDSTTGELAKTLTPMKYADPATSDFKVTVKSGSNRFDFDLKK